ncbi:transketolase [Rhizosphaericola mali]|uniref:Transketolase n=1 Tax=Rhizosphaericola mali TaxID=2545455 RepID=A0A5P2G8W6_9BACT|nr:transketolase [Rhizosphaericola mali]QES90160.1 transketolase [Rhizosphaericola mali]
MADIQELRDTATQIRRDIVRMVHGANSGHPGGSLGCTDFFTALYFDVMKRKPGFDMNGIGEDLFFLSNGHISPVFYSTLARAGYFPISELGTFRKLNSRVQGHPTTHEGLPGIRIASGSLGQGMSVAIGAALAKRQNGDDSIVYSLHGDGELNEGQNWEAIMSAPNFDLTNYIATIDWNGQQIDGPTKEVMDLGDLEAKFKAFKWQTIVVKEGNNIEEIIKALTKAKEMLKNGAPVAVLLETEMGKGVDYMEGHHGWHGKAPNDEQLASALRQLPETLGDY